MDLKLAKSKVRDFFEAEFQLDNFDRFLRDNLHRNYKNFKRGCFEVYKKNFLPALEGDERTAMQVMGYLKCALEAESVSKINYATRDCGNLLFKRGHDRVCYLFFSLLGFFKSDSEKQLTEKTSKKYRTNYLINLEADQSRGGLKLEEIFDEPADLEKRLYFLLGNCVEEGMNKENFERARKLYRGCFYGRGESNGKLRSEYMGLIIDLKAGKGGKERYAKISLLRL